MNAPPATYGAWCWQGGALPEQLVLQQLPLPQLAPGQVLVRNAVIGLNPVDWKVLDGDMGWPLGHVPGVDGAGTVAALGAGVAAEWLGKRVAYHQSLQAHGSFAQYTPVAATVLLQVPDTLEFSRAASVPCPGLTAWQALQKLPLAAGARLLVSGAGGAVGHYLVQLAVARGLRVTAMCNPRHWQRLQAFGVQGCVAGPFEPAQTWQEGPCFDAVIDSVNAEHASKLAAALRTNGHLLCIQGRVAQWPSPAYGRALSLHEVALGALHQHGDAASWQTLVTAGERLLLGLADGSLKAEPLVAAEFTELPAHLTALRHRQFSGKPIICIE